MILDTIVPSENKKIQASDYVPKKKKKKKQFAISSSLASNKKFDKR